MAPKDNEPKHKQDGKKTWHWCIHNMKWMVHKPDDCDLGKKEDQQGNKNQDIQWQVRANQATYAKMLAKFAQISIIKWWRALVWLAPGFPAMAKPNIITIIQAIILHTFPWGLHLLLSWIMIVSQ